MSHKFLAVLVLALICAISFTLSNTLLAKFHISPLIISIILGAFFANLFTKLELEKLRKKFGQVNFLSPENNDAKALRSALENLIKSGDQRLI